MGWQASQIHYESFGAQPTENDQAISVQLAKSKKTILVAANETILDAMLIVGIEVPHECKRGECSMCTTRIVEGEPDHRDLCLNKKEQASSMCVCVCVLRAKSEQLILDI